MRTKRDLEAMEVRRLAGARMLKRNISQSEVARAVEVSRQTVHIWAKQLAQANGAVGKLKAKALGRPRRLSAAQCESLSRILVAGALQAGFPTELWTIKRVRSLVAREFGVEYSMSGGWELLRSLGFSPQKPEKRATQRNEDAIVQWKRKTWPALKKKRSASSEPSSS